MRIKNIKNQEKIQLLNLITIKSGNSFQSISPPSFKLIQV